MKKVKEDVMEHSCDFVEVVSYDGNALSGRIMPSSSEDVVVLKLESGYNVGLNRKKIKEIKIVKKFGKSEEKCNDIIEDRVKGKISGSMNRGLRKDLPTISILHTGGTIASEVDYETGAVTPRFTPEEIVAMFPELKDIANIHSRLIRNMASDDMRFAHYNLMAKEIQKEIKKGVDGIIITHGTDTMGYSGAALSFALEDLPVPVLLVGAQRSSDRGSSDAALNLICAAQLIAKSNFAEVAICMHENMEDEYCLVMPGTKTRKLHTSRRDAFRVVNGRPFARVNKIGNIDYINHNFRKRDTRRKLKLRLFKENIKVGILKAHPNMYAKEFEFYSGFDGLVIEATGLGHIPFSKIDNLTKEHLKIRKAVRALCKKMPVVVAPQTIFGRLQMNVYRPARELQELGVVGNYSDMLSETTFIKLAWLLSNYPKQKIRDLICENLRGEISKRDEVGEFLDLS